MIPRELCICFNVWKKKCLNCFYSERIFVKRSSNVNLARLNMENEQKVNLMSEHKVHLHIVQAFIPCIGTQFV